VPANALRGVCVKWKVENYHGRSFRGRADQGSIDRAMSDT